MTANFSSIEAARIDRLAARHQLPDSAVGRLVTLAGMLAHDPWAPTAVREYSRVLDDHIADSLVALELDAVRNACSLADIGAGAGLPGLVLAVALPDATVTLIESSARKVAFIRSAIAACELGNAWAVHARVESWGGERASLDVVTARALDRLDVVAEYAAPLLKLGGTLVVWRGRRDAPAELQAQVAAELLGLEVADPVQVCPYAGAAHRHLHLLSKVGETPERFPRRPGVARRRPLGAAGHATSGSGRGEQTSDRDRR